MMNEVYIPKGGAKILRAKKSKYKNKRVQAAGRKFDSVGERDRFFFLQDAERRGQIRNLRCQVSFDLKVNEQQICRYIADFVYEHKLELHGKDWWPIVVEDFKGNYKKLPVFALKEKLMLAIHGIEIKIVKSPTKAL